MMKAQGNKLIQIISIPLTVFLLVACQSETTDLYETSRPQFDSQLDPGDPAEIDKSGLEVPKSEEVSELEVGEISDATISDPGEFKGFKGPQLEAYDQLISLDNAEIKPMLDLAFIMDDSNSMASHQIRVSDGMDDFVTELSKFNLLDFRITVVPIYDSRRYYKIDKSFGDPVDLRVTEMSRLESGKRNFYQLGTMIPLRKPVGPENYVELDQHFADRDTDTEILKETLVIGINPYQEEDVFDATTGELVKEATGPRYEEILAPMVAALNPEFLLFNPATRSHYRNQYPVADSINALSSSEREEEWRNYVEDKKQEFIRPPADLGVIVVTDTVDWSVNLSPSAAAKALRDLKGDDSSYSKISTYGVLHMNSISDQLRKSYGPGHLDPSSPWHESKRDCAKITGPGQTRVDDDVKSKDVDPFKEPQKLEEFLNITRGNKAVGDNIVNLCDGSENDTFGTKLAAIAKDLFNRSTAKVPYRLDKPPVNGITKVFFRGDENNTIPNCSVNSSDQICWSLIQKLGSQKIIFKNQGQADNNEIVVRYNVLKSTN